MISEVRKKAEKRSTEIIILAVILAAGTAATTYNNTNILDAGASSSDGLVAEYQFDTGAGNTAKDTAGNNDGTINGASWASGLEGEALSFDGDNDYAVTDNDFPVSGTNARTVSVWYKTSKDSTWFQNNEKWASLVDFPERESQEGSFMLAVSSDECNVNAIAIHMWSSNTCSGKTVEDVGLNEWHHLVGVMTGNGEQRIYIDGELEGTSNFNPDTPKGPVQIGRRSYSSKHYFSGELDDVRIYSQELNKSQVRSLYNRGSWRIGTTTKKDDPSKVLDISFQHQNNTHIYDTSGYENHGTRENGVGQESAVGCKVGRCYNFEGSYDSVETLDSSAFNIQNEFTLSVYQDRNDNRLKSEVGKFQVSSTGTRSIDTGFGPDIIQFHISNTNNNWGSEDQYSREEHGQGHGFVECMDDSCSNVGFTRGSGSDSMNGQAQANSDSYSIFQVITPNDGNGINGWIKGKVTDRSSTGFTVDLDQVDQSQYVRYTAYDLPDNDKAKVGFISTPTSTGTKSYNVGFQPNFLAVKSTNRLTSVDETLQDSLDGGWMHGFAASNKGGGISQFAMGTASYSNNRNNMAYKSSDSDIFTLIRSDDKSSITGRLTGSVSSFDSNGFDIDYSDVEDGQVAMYLAVDSTYTPEVGYSKTPTDTGKQKIGTDTELKHVSLISQAHMGDADVEGFDGSKTAQRGWMHGSGKTSDQNSMNIVTHSSSEDGHVEYSSSTEIFGLMYGEQDENIRGREKASITNFSPGSFTLDWSTVESSSNNYVCCDSLMMGYYGFSDSGVLIGKGTDAYELRVNSSDYIEGYVNNQKVTHPLKEEFQHLAFSYDSSQQKIYVNGQLQNSKALTGSINTNGKSLEIGSTFAGKIDQVKVFNRSLSQSEIVEKTQGLESGGAVLDLRFNRDGGDKAYDFSGEKNHGTLQPDASTGPEWIDGVNGNGLRFDGGDDRLDTTLEELDSGDTAHSVCLWYRLNEVPSSRVDPVSIGDASENEYSSVDIFSDRIQWYFYSNDVSINHKANPGKWEHLCLAYEGGGGTVENKKMYLNGEERQAYDSGGDKANLDLPADPKVGVGYDRGRNAAHFPGSIDNVRVFSYPLSKSKAQQLYSRGKSRVGSPSGSSSSKNLQDGLVLSQTFNRIETCGRSDTITCPSGASGEIAVDESGEANHGELVNGPAVKGAGDCRVGGCLGFDGSDDSVNVGDVGISFDGSQDFTISGWFKTGSNADGTFVELSSDGGTNFRINQNSNGDWTLSLEKDGNNDNADTHATDGSWHHGAIVYSGDQGKFYLDGEEDGSFSSSSWTYPGTDVNIGYRTNPNTMPFNGPIDNIRIYNRSLSNQEVWNLYTNGRDKETGMAGPMGWWRMDSINGGSTPDLAEGNDGAVSGANLVSGKVGKALEFDGSDDGVNVGNPSMDLTRSLSICLWIKPDDMSAQRENPIDKAYGGEFSFTLEDSSQGVLSTYFGSAGDNANPYATNRWSNVFQNDKWSHICWVRNNSAQDAKLYKNGADWSSYQTSSEWETPSQSSDSIQIGNGYTNSFDGSLDDVRIYPYALNKEQVNLVKDGGAVSIG